MDHKSLAFNWDLESAKSCVEAFFQAKFYAKFWPSTMKKWNRHKFPFLPIYFNSCFMEESRLYIKNTFSCRLTEVDWYEAKIYNYVSTIKCIIFDKIFIKLLWTLQWYCGTDSLFIKYVRFKESWFFHRFDITVHAEPWKLKNILICQVWHVSHLRVTEYQEKYDELSDFWPEIFRSAMERFIFFYLGHSFKWAF